MTERISVFFKGLGSRSILAVLAGLAAAGSLPACSMRPAPQESCNFVQNSEQQRVSWGQRLPVTFSVHTSFPAQHYPALEAAVKEWNRAIGREVLRLSGWTNSTSGPRQDQLNVIYLLPTWESNRANEQARTTLYWAGDAIQEADIRINGQGFQFFSGSRPEAGKVDMESLMLHELGHALGLGHTETPQSVMVRSLAYGSLRRDLSDADVSSVQCEY